MKRIFKYSIILFLFLILTQCKTNQLSQIKREISKSYTARFNSFVFNESRKLLYNSLSENILNSDTLVFIERFTNINFNYSCTLYESHTRQEKSYVAQTSIRNRKIKVDSLRISNHPDKVIKMIQMEKLDKIKRRGDATTLTPAATLIINIGIKDKENGRYNFNTLITQNF